jgi:hypothetical protein
MSVLRRAVLLLLFHSAAVAAYDESLSFRFDDATGSVVAVISGYVPLCAARVVAPLLVSMDGTTITITSNALDNGGGCVPPPAYHGPSYEVTASLGNLPSPLYTVTWRWLGYSYDSFHRTVLLAPASLVAQAVPTLQLRNVVVLGFLLVVSVIFVPPRRVPEPSGRTGDAA